uniref:Uncharacterized protein n=1 Tax=Salmo trutta TaxID=8032 RepID=A0A674CVP3_SALTR
LFDSSATCLTVLVVSLDNAGKTTIIRGLQGGELLSHTVTSSVLSHRHILTVEVLHPITKV